MKEVTLKFQLILLFKLTSKDSPHVYLLQQTINVNFPRLGSSSSMWWLNGFWIGLTAVEGQGTWVWVNNTEASST